MPACTDAFSTVVSRERLPRSANAARRMSTTAGICNSGRWAAYDVALIFEN